MLRIGDAAKRFDLSNRTLRYWEERGILKSSRFENGYRYYDGENERRIKQIFLLRRLGMPLADIEKIFLSYSLDTVIHALSCHLEQLKRRAAANQSLAVSVEKLLGHIKSEQNPDQVFTYLEKQGALSEHGSASKVLLSEREDRMLGHQLNNVRIVRLPAMTVVSYRAVSETPEEDCSKLFFRFVLDNKLHEQSGFRLFGFNNPSPSEGDPVYGYEMWVTVPGNFNPPQPFQKKRFSGGLYASISSRLNEIGERWGLLHFWCESSEEYQPDDSVQWLEEYCTDPERFFSGMNDSERQLDLLEPVKYR